MRTGTERTRAVILAGAFGSAGLLVGLAGPAGADPVAAGTARAHAAAVEAGGQAVVPPTPAAEVVAPPGGNVAETLVNIPAEPLAISGTLNAEARVHGPSDLPSALTVNTQSLPGPYNVRGTALIEDLDVLLDVPADDVSLVSADVVRAEAVGVCTAGAVSYAANSEIVDLRVGGEAIPLNAPVEDLIDAIGDVLTESGLNQVVDVRRNVVTTAADGIAVDALVVTLLAAAGDAPLARVVIGHAEASGVRCGSMPECSDGADNDGDGAIDHPADPNCTGPDDLSESPECSDGIDNDDPEDELADAADPGCHSDGDAANPGTYDPDDDDEADSGQATLPTGTQRPAGPVLARTGAGAPMAAALALAALGVLGWAAVRRSSTA